MGNKISVIMPIYNNADFLKEAIESILNQTYENYEVLVIDDGSTDNTSDIIAAYKDRRIKYYLQDHSGLIDKLNFGISEAEGLYIARMDGDDISHVKRFEKQVNFLEKHPEIHLVGTNYNIFEKGKLLYKELPKNHDAIEFMMPVLNSICHATILTYKEILKEVGGYKKDCIYAEDTDLFLRLLKKDFKMHNIQEPLYKRRIWDGSISNRRIKEQKESHYKICIEHLEYYYSRSRNTTSAKYDHYFRMGLLNYYNDRINKSRRNFYYCIKYRPFKILKIFRYLIPTLLGEKMMIYLRREGILSQFNSLLLRLLKIDTQKI